MTHEDLRRLVVELRLHRRELENVEVKRAQRGTPRRMWLWKSTRRPRREVSISPLEDNETDIVNISCTYEELAACALSRPGE